MNAHSTQWFYSDLVVDGALNPLFETKIPFGGLNRNVTEQKLDLLQFASGGVPKPCAGSAEILPDPNRVSEELLWALGLGRVRFQVGFRNIVRGPP
jgi:hypothetical protein